MTAQEVVLAAIRSDEARRVLHNVLTVMLVREALVEAGELTYEDAWVAVREWVADEKMKNPRGPEEEAS